MKLMLKLDIHAGVGVVYRLTFVALTCLGLSTSFALGNFQIPPYASRILANKIRVDYLKHTEVPLVQLLISIDVGSMHEGADLGLAYLTAKSMTLGSKTLSKEAFEEKMDFMSARWGIDSSKETTTLSVSCAKDDLNGIINIVADMLRFPLVPEKKLDELKNKTLSELTELYETPSDVIKRYFDSWLFYGTGYDHPTMGVAATITKIDRKKILDFYRAYYRPENVRIVLAGDFEDQSTFARLEQSFGTWLPADSISLANNNQKGAQQGPMPAVRPGVILVDKPDAVQATFLIGGRGISQNDHHRIEINLINTVLGGRFTSWLNKALRIDSGLSYGARSNFTMYRNFGSFYISSFTKTETAVEALDLALQTYRRLKSQGVSQEDLNSAKNYVKGMFPTGFETATDLSGYINDAVYYHLDPSLFNQFYQKVDSLTPSSSINLIKKDFPEEPLVMVVIGQAKSLRDKLKKYGKIREFSLTDQGLTY